MMFRRFAIASCTLALPLAIAGCSEDQDIAEPELSTSTASETASETPSETGSETPSETANETTEPEYSLVSPAEFLDERGETAVIEMDKAGTNYFCVLGAASVACSANPDDSVPNLEDMPDQPWAPFTGRPGAIFASDDGVSWGVLEGIPAGDGALAPGERLEHLNGWCQVPDEESIECGYNDASFIVTGPDRTVVQ